MKLLKPATCDDTQKSLIAAITLIMHKLKKHNSESTKPEGSDCDTVQ